MASAAVRWRERPLPLPPRAVLGLGPAARALHRRLLREGDDALPSLEGAAAGGVLAVLSEGPLPWADGVIYLGRDPRAPSLLLPTTLEPEIHPALLAEAVAARLAAPRASGLVAVLPEAARLIVLEQPRSLSRAALAALGERL